MLPKVLQTIINNYNEFGIYITFDNEKIYWFNAIRFEYWCKVPLGIVKKDYRGDFDILTHNNSLYINNYDQYVTKFKYNKFTIQNVKKLKWNHSLSLKWNQWNECNINGSIYSIGNNLEDDIDEYKMKKHHIKLPTDFSQVQFTIGYKERIYYFTPYDGKHFYYNTKQDQWFCIANMNIEYKNFHPYLIHDKVYIFTKKFYLIYNIQEDLWSDKNFL